MVHLLLPPEIYDTSPALPTLIAYASANKPQALAAISVLENLNAIMECKPASASVFLDQILLSGTLLKFESYQNESQSPHSNVPQLHSSITSQDKLSMLSKKNKMFKFFSGMKKIEDLIRDSNVLIDKDGASWNWNFVRAVLKVSI